jgi:hypothetical protein
MSTEKAVSGSLQASDAREHEAEVRPSETNETLNSKYVPPPYRRAGPIALYIKAVAQMIVGTVATLAVIATVTLNIWQRDPATHIQEQVFGVIGIGLAVAAGIELAYTLFTSGPDEALDPLLLALSAALILQLGKQEEFSWTAALALLLYAVPLVVLLKIRPSLKIEGPSKKDELALGTRVISVAALVIVLIVVVGGTVFVAEYYPQCVELRSTATPEH